LTQRWSFEPEAILFISKLGLSHGSYLAAGVSSFEKDSPLVLQELEWGRVDGCRAMKFRLDTRFRLTLSATGQLLRDDSGVPVVGEAREEDTAHFFEQTDRKSDSSPLGEQHYAVRSKQTGRVLTVAGAGAGAGAGSAAPTAGTKLAMSDYADAPGQRFLWAPFLFVMASRRLAELRAERGGKAGSAGAASAAKGSGSAGSAGSAAGSASASKSRRASVDRVPFCCCLMA
jgi:hypothetical protein